MAAVTAMAVSTGCSISYSLESSADVISSPFKSSSGDAGDSSTQVFNEQTEGYTAAFIEAGGGSGESFQKGISDLAAQRGISNWEAIPDTWTSVGRGLAGAEVDQAAVTAYAQSWSGGDEQIVALVMQGYQQVQ